MGIFEILTNKQFKAVNLTGLHFEYLPQFKEGVAI